MWEQSVSRLVVASLVGGVLCGALWDLFRIQRILLGISEYPKKAEKNSRVAVFFFVLLQDVTFFLVFACILALVFYYGNNGNFQIYALVFTAAGAFTYAKTAGVLTAKLARGLRALAKRAAKGLTTALKKVSEKTVSFFKKIKLRKAEKNSKEAI